MKDQYTCQSGAILTMTVAPFDSAKKLFRALMNEGKSVELDLEGLNLRKLSMSSLSELDINPNTIKNLFAQVLGSEKFEEALHECFVTGPCLYNNQKIVKVNATFNPEEARGDYFGCAWEVALLNLRGFFPKLALPSSTPEEGTKNVPR